VSFVREEQQSAPATGSRALLKTALVRFISAFVVLSAVFFLSAGTLYYWQAWVYLFILMVPAAFVGRYLFKNDPKLLERRMRAKETQKTQKIVIALSVVFFLPAFILPGLDVRFGWSNVPFPVIIIADAMVLLGYLIVALVFKANSYASRIVEVEKGQKVISTGPYAIVRHPMYSGVIIFYLFSTLALGSYWAMIPAVHIIPLLIVRIIGEEKELLTNLDGYKEYVAKTRYRLIPGIW
jgi:protein-S-isoprenylcysteine O-methyltransferase Ste14